MVRICAVGRVTNVQESGDDAYVYVQASFWSVDTASRESVTVIFCCKTNSFVKNLPGRSVYAEGTDPRIVKGADGNASIVVMQSRIESA